MKTVKAQKNFGFLGIIQYAIAIILTILFIVGLVPFKFDDIFVALMILIVSQIVISAIRFRFLNVILEIVLLILGVLSLIPFLGYPFRIIAILILIFEISTFKNTVIYAKTVNFAKDFKEKKTKKKKQVKKEKEFKEANFKEK